MKIQFLLKSTKETSARMTGLEHGDTQEFEDFIRIKDGPSRISSQEIAEWALRKKHGKLNKE